MEEKSSSISFETLEEQREAIDWLAVTGSLYLADLSEIEKRLATELEDVENYFDSDPAYNAASRFALGTKVNSVTLAKVTDRIIRIAKKRPWRNIHFSMIRRRVEVELMWRQGLSLVIANYLDGTSYKLATETKATANRIADLLARLESELESLEASQLLDSAFLPVMNWKARHEMQGLQVFFQSDEIQKSFSFRKDRHLLGRITARELLLANKWAFHTEYKKVALILMGSSAFKTPIDIEVKTLERIWAKRDEQQWAINDAYREAREVRRMGRDKRPRKKRLHSDPPIPNPTRFTFGD